MISEKQKNVEDSLKPRATDKSISVSFKILRYSILNKLNAS